MKEFSVNSSNAGQRLNKYCGRILQNAPQSFIYKMLRKKNITLNDKRADGNEILSTNDTVKFFLSDETFEKFSGAAGKRYIETAKNNTRPGSDSDLDRSVKKSKTILPTLKGEEIVYEDENILICFKPEGELSQKAKPEDVSINERIVEYLSSKQTYDEVKFVPGVCNRLDRNTKGLITAGKNLRAQSFLSRMFRERTIHKYYIAVVKGELKGMIDSKLFLSKDNVTNKVRISREATEDAQLIHSVFKGIAYNNGFSIVKIRLETGKSHQIRAQLAYLGFPVLGDTKYGDVKINRILADEFEIRTQMLLAYELVFPECSGSFSNLSKKRFKCRIPYEFTAFWKENKLWAHGSLEDLEVHF